MRTGAPPDLTRVADFGKVAAEDDPVLEYFLSTEAYQRISVGDVLLVLGRKGAGKTALVRAFTERPVGQVVSKSLNFRAYPWSVHGSRVDAGASPVEAYTASWEYFLAVQLASLVVKRLVNDASKAAQQLTAFLKKNYGSIDADSASILLPDSLRLEGSFEPSVLGLKLFSLSLKRQSDDKRLGRELSALSSALLDAVAEAACGELGGHTILLHLDELDNGLSTLDPNRAAMFVGLVLAARQVKRRFESRQPRVCPVIYLRTDIWDELRFSDKNKITETQTLAIEWKRDQLQELIEKRAIARLGQQVRWADLEDGSSMRGSQQKWDHICARTYQRPRDVIKFCNAALAQLKQRQPSGPPVFTNRDIVGARVEYSAYLKAELEDEIGPHWPDWTVALDAISALRTITFDVRGFALAYNDRRKDGMPSSRDALERLFQFSIIGFPQSSGYGGTTWIFRYEKPGVRWNPGAARCKVHPGLKEYCNLREERRGDDPFADFEEYVDTDPEPEEDLAPAPAEDLDPQ